MPNRNWLRALMTRNLRPTPTRPARRLALLALEDRAVPATLLVGPGETYTTIQAAVDAAVTGDEIEVQPGTYNEDVYMASGPAGLVLRSAQGPAVTTIVGVANAGYNDTINIGNGQTIDGFTITRTLGTGENNIGLANVVGATGYTVTNNVFTGNRTAVYMNGGAAAGTYSNNLIENNRTGFVLPDLSYGAHQITGNVIRNNKTFGMVVTGDNAGGPTTVSSGFALTGNAIYGNLASGLEYNSASPFNAQNNWWGTANPLVTASKLQGNLPAAFAYPGPSEPQAGYSLTVTGGNSASVDLSPFQTSGDGISTDPDAPGFTPAAGAIGVTTQGGSLSGQDRIQEGVTAVASGGTVLMAPGTYTLSTTNTISKPLTLTGGSDRTLVTVNTGNVPGQSWGLAIEASEVTLDGFTVQGRASATPAGKTGPGSGYAIHSSPGADSLTVTNLRVTGSHSSGLDINGANGLTVTDVQLDGTTRGYGLALSSVKNATITNLTTSGNVWGDVGIYPTGAGNLPPPAFVAQNVQFGAGVDLKGMTNTSGTGYINVEPTGDLPVTIGTTAGSDVQVPAGYSSVYNRRLSGAAKFFTLTPSTNAVALAQALVNPPNAGNFVEVTIRSLDTGVWTVAPGLKIQDAINQASSGDTINVQAGTYTSGAASTTTVNKPLTLRGANYGTLGSGTRVDETFVTGAEDAFTVTAAGVTIDGFTLWDVTGVSAGGSGVWVTSTASGTTVTNNIISGNRIGVYVNSRASDEEPTVVSNNLFVDNTASGPAGGVNLYSFGVSNLSVTGNTFRNSVSTVGTWAIGVDPSGTASPQTGISITDNMIDGFGRGVYLYDTTGAVIDGNTFIGTVTEDATVGYAVGLFGYPDTTNADVTVTDNQISGFLRGLYLADDGVSASSGTLTVTGNEFADSNIYYIVNESATEIDASENVFAGVGGDDLSVAQGLATADKVVDAVDVPTYGKVVFQDFSVYVTASSFYSTGDTVAPSVQRAVDVADEGDTVFVGVGTYTGSVVVPVSIALVGPNAGLLDLDEPMPMAGVGLMGPRNPEAVIDGVVEVDADGVAVLGFQLNGGAVAGEAGDVGVFLRAGATDTLLFSNRLTGTGDGRGVLSTFGGGNDGLTVWFNDITDWTTGVFNQGNTGVSVVGNVITGNAAGVANDYVTDVSIELNQITDNGEAVGVFASSGVVVFGNDLSGNDATVSNYGGDIVDASGNYWGTTDAGAILASTLASPFNMTPGAVDFSPYLAAAFDFGTLYTTDLGTQTEGDVVSEAFELVDDGGTIYRTVAEGDLVSFTVAGLGDSPYTASGLPALATFDTGTGAFSWTPAEGDDGSYSIGFGSAGFDATLALTVTEVNVAPVLDSIVVSDGPYSEGTAITFSATASDTDEPVNELTYTWEVTKDGEFYADGEGDSGSFTPDDDGEYVVTFTVSDGEASDTASSDPIEVANVAPTAAITPPGTVTGTEGQAITLGSTATDPSAVDEAELTYAWSVEKDGADYGATGDEPTFSFTPDDNGTYVVTLVVSDGEDDTTVTKTIVVDNAAPTIASSDIDVAATQESPAGTAVLGFEVVADDAGDDTLTYKTGFTTSATPTAAQLDAAFAAGQDGTAYSTTTAGTYFVWVRVYDGDGGFATSTTPVRLAVGSLTAADTLTGTDSLTIRDVLFGRGGNDVLTGGKGNDVLVGGTGNDQFVFNGADVASNDQDVIRDYEDGATASAGDKIRLSGFGYTSLSSGQVQNLSPTSDVTDGFSWGSNPSGSARVQYQDDGTDTFVRPGRLSGATWTAGSAIRLYGVDVNEVGEPDLTNTDFSFPRAGGGGAP